MGCAGPIKEMTGDARGLPGYVRILFWSYNSLNFVGFIPNRYRICDAITI